MRKDGGANENENFGRQKQYKCHITKEKTGKINNMTGPTITSEGFRALINHQPNNLVRS